MSRIRSKDTTIEKELRKELYNSHIGYFKNVSSLPGHPDIVLRKYKIAIFVDGDFFHGYDLNKIESNLKTNKDFWIEKIKKNQARDIKSNEKLISLGYTVLRFWGHEIRNDIKSVLKTINDTIYKLEETEIRMA